MDTSTLASLQKRAMAWEEEARLLPPTHQIRKKLLQATSELRSLIFDSWSKGSVSEEAKLKIQRCEERLEGLSEDARLLAGHVHESTGTERRS